MVATSSDERLSEGRKVALTAGSIIVMLWLLPIGAVQFWVATGASFFEELGGIAAYLGTAVFALWGVGALAVLSVLRWRGLTASWSVGRLLATTLGLGPALGGLLPLGLVLARTPELLAEPPLVIPVVLVVVAVPTVVVRWRRGKGDSTGAVLGLAGAAAVLALAELVLLAGAGYFAWYVLEGLSTG